MPYKTILFDVDNTLIDSAAIATNVLHKIVSNYGYHNVSKQSIRNRVGIPTDKILLELGLDSVDEITSDFTIAIGQHKDELEFFNGIQSLLTTLKKKSISTGIVTSRTSAEVKSDLGAFPEITSSNIIVTADKTTEHKPSGAPLEYAVQEYNLVKADTIYVGDTIYDMQAAQNANMDFASATWGALPTTDFSAATFQPQQPQDLLQLLTK